jgi:predicted Zn-dependent protease with MMP-like domain
MRGPAGAVCAVAPVAGNDKTPASATQIAVVLIPIITPILEPVATATSPIAAPRSTVRPAIPDAGGWNPRYKEEMWRSLKAPSLAEMEAMAHEIFGRLPRTFRDLCEGVIIRVDDFPTEEVLDEMEAESEFDLLGLFAGVGLPHQSHDDIARLPNMVWLYRRPILDYWAEHDEALGHIVRHVLIHEIGHHFGLSDDDMAAIEAAAD